MLLLDSGTSTQKGGILAMLQSVSHNFKPIFTQEQLAASIQATILLFAQLQLLI